MSNDVVPIVYGMPGPSQRARALAGNVTEQVNVVRDTFEEAVGLDGVTTRRNKTLVRSGGEIDVGEPGG
ncbi:hypothetical protein [Embleya sp. NPDC050493]|uniref:hypothetical protein n=1 Tax=Embleya sp. NPDC050493 TaxID=3363989 RepID=UPI00378C38A8